MANQQLTAYIKEEISKGANNKNIRNALLQNGWNSSDIDEAFSVPQTPASSVPVAPNGSVQAQAPVTSQVNNVEEDGIPLNKQMHLHPRAVWLFFLQSLSVWILTGIVIYFQSVISVFQNSMNSVSAYVMLILAIFIAMFVTAYLVARLSYHFYRYELAEHEYKAERGIIRKRYISIPYARIQNVDIYRGLLSRILGLSDLKIQTAGQSGTTGSEGDLPALGKEHAEIVREALMAKARTEKGGAGM